MTFEEFKSSGGEIEMHVKSTTIKKISLERVNQFDDINDENAYYDSDLIEYQDIELFKVLINDEERNFDRAEDAIEFIKTI